MHTIMMTASGSFNTKGCSKIIIKKHILELLPFCVVFNSFVNLSNIYTYLMMLKSELSKTTDIFL